MESGTSTINLNQVTFPVFRLGNDRPLLLDNVLMYYRQYQTDEEEIKTVYKVIDDRNIDKPTLALRRLELSKKKVPMKKLSRAIFFLSDLIKLSNRHTWFIDSKGNIFQYKKENFVKLIFKKITKIIPIPSGGAIIEVDGIANRFKTLYMPPAENKYAGLLKNGIGYILYGTYPEQHEDTKRMI